MAKITTRDLEFRVTSARLEAFFDAPPRTSPGAHRLAWGVVVETTSAGAKFDWEPRFTAERLFETKPLEVPSFRDLNGRQGSWGDDGEIAFLYTFTHESVVNARWKVILSASGRLVFALNGFSNFDHEGGLVGLLPVSVETELAFAPIPCGSRAERECRARLSRFGIKDRFDFRVVDGVSELVPI